MFTKFHKGATYLVKDQGVWYICQQSGMKSWEAIVFTHVNTDVKKYLHGNGTTLPTYFVDPEEWLACSSDSYLRKQMFSVLKTGQIYKEI